MRKLAHIVLFLGLTLLWSYAIQADDFRSYVEWKNEIKMVNSNHKVNIDHLRFGAKFNKFYGEIGPMSTDIGSGISAELGYKFKFKKRWELKGKWEGTTINDILGHKLETELRFYFN